MTKNSDHQAPEKKPASSSSLPDKAANDADGVADQGAEQMEAASFPIVGVGASAGGLEAITQLLKALPAETGMAFVLVQHLAPTHASALAEILSRATTMPVMEVHDEPEVEPNHVYVIPPGQDMVISDGTLQLRRHNVLADRPFSRIDLISCRNLLIYLEPVLQQQIVPMLHYALKPDGFLWLGGSETIGGYRNLFEAEDPKHKIYAKKPGPHGAHFPLQLGATPRSSLNPIAARPSSPRSDLHREADRLLLSKFAPPSVLVSAELDILQYRGDTGPYLAPAPGKASLNLLRMLRQGLLVGVRAATLRAAKEGSPVREEGLRVKSNGGWRELAVEGTDRHLAAAADLPEWRPDPAGSSRGQPAQQRLQIHRQGRSHLAHGRATGRRPSSACATPASALPPINFAASSRYSCRSILRWTGRRAGWASA